MTNSNKTRTQKRAMDAVVEALSQDSLQHLSLKTAIISASAARQLSSLVRQCKRLQDIEVSLQYITLDALRALFLGATQCTSLRRIVVSGGLSVIQAKVLSSCLKSFTLSPLSTSPASIHAAVAFATAADHDMIHNGLRGMEYDASRFFGPVGVTLVLEPAAFNDVAAAIMYDGIEGSTRIVQVEVRSSVANAHILTVLPRFHRRVQGTLKRNARLVAGAQRQFEEVARVAIFHALQQQQQQVTDSPTCRVLDFSSKLMFAGHRIDMAPAPSSHVHPTNSPSIPRHFQPLEFDECSSTTPSPHIPLPPPEPVQFRHEHFQVVPSQPPLGDHDHYSHPYERIRDQCALAPPIHMDDAIFKHTSILHSHIGDSHTSPYPPAPSSSQPQQTVDPSLPHPVSPLDDTSRPFQRHVILEMAALRHLVVQQTKDVEDMRVLMRQLQTGNDLVLRELSHLAGHQQQHNVAPLQPLPPRHPAPPAPLAGMPSRGLPRSNSGAKPPGSGRPPRPTMPVPPASNGGRGFVCAAGRRVITRAAAPPPVAPPTRRPNIMFPRAG